MSKEPRYVSPRRGRGIVTGLLMLLGCCLCGCQPVHATETRLSVQTGSPTAMYAAAVKAADEVCGRHGMEPVASDWADRAIWRAYLRPDNRVILTASVRRDDGGAVVKVMEYRSQRATPEGDALRRDLVQAIADIPGVSVVSDGDEDGSGIE